MAKTWRSPEKHSGHIQKESRYTTCTSLALEINFKLRGTSLGAWGIAITSSHSYQGHIKHLHLKIPVAFIGSNIRLGAALSQKQRRPRSLADQSLNFHLLEFLS